MLYLIGIGLGDEKDITVRGLEAVKKCKKIFLESYTSKLQCSASDLEKIYGNKVIEANREFVEEGTEILESAKKENTALLIIGDVFGATTHFEIYKRALEGGIKVEVINNTSIINAVSITGLQLYKFGRTASIPFREVDTPYDILKENQKQGLHTLFLLDIEDEEDKYMTVKQALEYLLKKGLDEKTVCVGCARLGSDFKIRSGKAKELLNEDFGGPPHSLIVPGKMHFSEEEALEIWD